MKQIKGMLPYLIVLALVFYLLPLLIKETSMAMFVMLVAIPISTVVISVVFGVKKGFLPIFGLLAAAIFAPTIFIYYNSSALIYVVVYGILALVGNAIGGFFYKRK